MRKLLAWIVGICGIIFGFFLFSGFLSKLTYSLFANGYKFLGFTIISETGLSSILGSAGIYFVGIEAYKKIDKENGKSFLAFLVLCLFLNVCMFFISVFLFFDGQFGIIEALIVLGAIISILITGLEHLKINNTDGLGG